MCHLLRRWWTGTDGMESHNGACGGGAQTRMAASLHTAGPGQQAYLRHSPVSTRASSHWLGTRLEWGEGRSMGRVGPGRRGRHTTNRGDTGHGPIRCPWDEKSRWSRSRKWSEQRRHNDIFPVTAWVLLRNSAEFGDTPDYTLWILRLRLIRATVPVSSPVHAQIEAKSHSGIAFMFTITHCKNHTYCWKDINVSMKFVCGPSGPGQQFKHDALQIF